MSRKKLKNRRRKDRAQRKILIAAVCIAAVIIGVGIGGHVIKKNAGKTMTTAETESKKAVSKKEATAKKLTINENETDASNKENQGQKDQADDRSEFAVQPGRKVGTTEQSDEKVVYLTLDDGPSKNTQAVLDILDKYNAKATFFVTGAMPEYKDMINYIRQASPNTDIVLCAVSPVTRAERARHTGMKQIPIFNKKLKKLAKKVHANYLDYTDFLKDSGGYLKAQYAAGDGYHWKNPAYTQFGKVVGKYDKALDH